MFTYNLQKTTKKTIKRKGKQNEAGKEGVS